MLRYAALEGLQLSDLIGNLGRFRMICWGGQGSQEMKPSHAPLGSHCSVAILGSVKHEKKSCFYST